MHPVVRRTAKAGLMTLGVALPAASISTYVGARILTDAPKPRERQPAHRARFAEAVGTIELMGPSAGIEGTWGLDFEGGFARVGDVQALVDSEYGPAAIRPFELLDGNIPDRLEDRRHGQRRSGGDRRGSSRTAIRHRMDLRAVRSRVRRRLRPRGGERRTRDRRSTGLPPPWPVPVYVSPYAYPDDPQILAHRVGATWSVDAVRTPQGVWLPAWRFVPDNPSTTWVVGIHGRGARRTELFRLMEIALRAGLPCMVVSYRTDAWTSSPTALTTLGQTEWEDVASAIRHLLKDGAHDVVLAGCSLGGGIAAQVLRRSAIAPYVHGVILDSPALQWAPIVRHVARSRRLPSGLTPLVMEAARLRSRIDWSALDHLAAAQDFRHPILLIHGSDDDVVPVWLSDALAEARPDLVTYLRVEGAGHVTGWNHQPDLYARAVADFLAEARLPLTPAA